MAEVNKAWSVWKLHSERRQGYAFTCYVQQAINRQNHCLLFYYHTAPLIISKTRLYRHNVLDNMILSL